MVRKSSRKKYTGFSLEKDFEEEIIKYISDHPEQHYKTVISFIKDAIREKLNKKETVIKSKDIEIIKKQITQLSGQINEFTGLIKGDNEI